MSRIHRLNQLPAVLEPNSVYLIKTPTGVKIYAANMAGSEAYTYSRRIMLLGPTSLFPNEVGVYTIHDYTIRETYVLSSIDGVVTRDGDQISFVVSNSTLTEASFTVNGRVFTVVIKPVEVIEPAIVSPLDGDTGIEVTGTTVYASPFALNYEGATDTQVAADWEVATDPNFTNIVASSYDDPVNLNSWTIPD